MAYIVLVFCCILSCIKGSNLVRYKFNSNFGQIFYDYSGSGNHGQNGDSIDPDYSDTIPTSRGAYFKDSYNYIKLPNNDIQLSALNLGSQFSILMWFHHFEGAKYDTHMTMRITENYLSSFALVRKYNYDCHYLSFKFPDLSEFIYSSYNKIFFLSIIY